MEPFVIVIVVVVSLLLAGGGMRDTYGRNAEEMVPDRGDRIPPPPGFERRDGPL